MNIHLILFYLAKLALAINLEDSKSERFVQKCSPINCELNKQQTINLQGTIKSVNNLQLNQQLKKRSKRKRISLSVRDTNQVASRLNDKLMSEQFVTTLNKELYERSRIKKSNEEQVNKVDKLMQQNQQHDQLHSNQHNEHHYHLNNQNSRNNEYQINQETQEQAYVNKQKIKKLEKDALDSLQQIFEVELPPDPTFNHKFVELIQALIIELKHIKNKLWQANCKMRLSFKNNRIFSDCETNHEQPCNCPVDHEDEEESNQALDENKKLISNQIESINLSSNHQNLSTNEQNNNSSIANEKPLVLPSIKQQNPTLTNSNQTKTDNHHSPTKAEQQSLTKLNSTSSTFKNATTTTLTTDPESKSKKETELSKQLKSAIDCFLCKKQWSNCLNVGFKCP